MLFRATVLSMAWAIQFASPWGAVAFVPVASMAHQPNRQPAEDSAKFVWVNPRSSVYHCPGSAVWGNTKRGLTMSEDDAVRLGHRPAGGRHCGLTQTDLANPSGGLPLLAGKRRPLAPTDTVQVWVNTGSGVFHCRGTRYYGATKAGRYMDQAAARASGYRAAHGDACD